MPATSAHANRERVRAIVLLASLAGDNGRPLGVRAISRRTGLSPATISLWLRIGHRPPLLMALAEERLDIGRAMILARVPDQALDELIECGRRLARRELADRVAALELNSGTVAARRNAANERRARVAVGRTDADQQRAHVTRRHPRADPAQGRRAARHGAR